MKKWPSFFFDSQCIVFLAHDSIQSALCAIVRPSVCLSGQTDGRTIAYCERCTFAVWCNLFWGSWCRFETTQPCCPHGIIFPCLSTAHWRQDNQTTSDCRRLLTSLRQNVLEGQQRPTVGRWLSIQTSTCLVCSTVKERARQVWFSQCDLRNVNWNENGNIPITENCESAITETEKKKLRKTETKRKRKKIETETDKFGYIRFCLCCIYVSCHQRKFLCNVVR